MSDPTPPIADRNHIKTVPLHSPRERERDESRLPAPLTSFVSREREVAAIVGLLHRPDVRLVTLTGPGGVGKTRLALRVAEEAATTLGDEVAFVSLAPVRDPAFLTAIVAEEIGMPEVAGRDPLAAVPDFLGDRRFLLVLDNLEHLLPAGSTVTSWLAACPNLTVLVTSRSVLRVTGEHRFDVAPLAVPNLERLPPFSVLADNPAIRLFVERARASRADFMLTPDNAAAVAAICVRLDGLPLAIELAAARVQHLPPPALLSRLERRLSMLTGGPRDQPVRLQTMGDAIAWSYDLLSIEEQGLLRCLSVFVGSFTLEAAEAVRGDGPAGRRTVGPDNSSITVLDGIASLVGKSLLVPVEKLGDQPRYQMLETVREFGLERWADAGDGEAVAARAAHAAYFLALAERAVPVVLGGNSVAWLDRLAADHDNFGAALDHLCRPATADLCLQLAGACGWYWFRRGHIGEGRVRLDRALALAGPDPTAAKGRALRWAGSLAAAAGDLPAAAALASKGLAIWDTVDDPRGRVFALHQLGQVEERSGHWDAATALYEEVLAYWRELGEPSPIGMVLRMLGGVAYGQGDLARSRTLLDEAAALFRAAGDRTWEAATDWDLGTLAAAERRFSEAARRLRYSLRGFIDAGDASFLHGPLHELAGIAVESGQPESAARLLGAADAQLRRTGAGLLPADRPAYERTVASARAALGEAEFAAAHAAGRDLDQDAWFGAADLIVAAMEESAARVPPHPVDQPAGLTPREVEVLILVAGGLSDREAAAALFVGPSTVRSHLTRIFGKLGVGSRTAAIAHARRHGIL